MKILKSGILATGLAGLALSAQAEVSHVVFFELKDNSGEKIDALIDGAHEYLCDIEGVVSCQVGSRQTERESGSNDTGYDVALIVTLDTEESHKGYDTDPSHIEFIGKFRDNWKNVRVMDSNLVAGE
ncbi:MAG: stress responsive protein [Ponticaulis sp.]|nr:stress responsive protein [Ponticaulis sp.]|tara:strand:+ start:143 stop:523 length:381 start_codon:yes stop_codon:yes gene_type:complete